MERQSELILVVVLPGDNGVTLSRKLLETLYEAAMKENLLGRVAIRPTLQALCSTVALLLVGHEVVHHFVQVVSEGHLFVHAIFRHHLDVVFLVVLREE